jgi:hypothetical protein
MITGICEMSEAATETVDELLIHVVDIFGSTDNIPTIALDAATAHRIALPSSAPVSALASELESLLGHPAAEQRLLYLTTRLSPAGNAAEKDRIAALPAIPATMSRAGRDTVAQRRRELCWRPRTSLRPLSEVPLTTPSGASASGGAREPATWRSFGFMPSWASSTTAEVWVAVKRWTRYEPSAEAAAATADAVAAAAADAALAAAAASAGAGAGSDAALAAQALHALATMDEGALMALRMQQLSLRASEARAAGGGDGEDEEDEEDDGDASGEDWPAFKSANADGDGDSNDAGADEDEDEDEDAGADMNEEFGAFVDLDADAATTALSEATTAGEPVISFQEYLARARAALDADDHGPVSAAVTAAVAPAGFVTHGSAGAAPSLDDILRGMQNR